MENCSAGVILYIHSARSHYMDYSHSVRPHWCPFFLQHLVEMLYRAKDCCSPSNVFLGSSSNGDRTEQHSHQFSRRATTWCTSSLYWGYWVFYYWRTTTLCTFIVFASKLSCNALRNNFSWCKIIFLIYFALF